MDQIKVAGNPETPDIRRMELRGIVRLAGEVIARYWPMRTFVHHNPFHSLEYLHFEEAVRRGRKFLGGHGYLSGETYRGYLRSGRIRLDHLEQALQPLARDEHVTVGPCRIAHREVLQGCLTHGLCAVSDEPLDALLDRGASEVLETALADHLALAPALHAPTVEEEIATVVREDGAALGRYLTLSDWCDRTLGTDIVAAVNAELIKWCEAFLDEGQATWSMPGREQGFYTAWKCLAGREWSPCGIQDSRRKIAQLPDQPEDAVLESLAMLGIADDLRQDYLSLQLTALPGWAGLIKWRGDQQDYAWQQAYPISLVKFLAVRLWYIRELVRQTCREALDIEGNFLAISAYMQDHPHAYFLRKEHVAGRLPAAYTEQVQRLSTERNSGNGWKAVADRLQGGTGPQRDRSLRLAAARRLIALAQALDIVPTVLLDGDPNDLARLIAWMDEFPESDHGPTWLKAFEAGYHEQMFDMLMRTASTSKTIGSDSSPVRPQSQSVFCIDVRSEPFRRHLESTGDNATYGFAGFFAAFIRYRAWGTEHDTEQFPVIMRARNEVREIPRSYLDHMVSKHESRAKLLHAGHTLLHDLKENVVTPYVMVESLGWFYGLPIVGKTAWPALYRRFTVWVRRLLVPSIATSLTVDKLAPTDIQEMLIAEQRAVIRKALRDQLNIRGSRIVPEFVEAVRLHALNGGGIESSLIRAAEELSISKDRVAAFVETLRRQYRINQRSASSQKQRITQN